jgi:hypothetical protein
MTTAGARLSTLVALCLAFAAAMTPPFEDREYDLVMPMFSATGHFEPAGLKTIQESFADLHLDDHAPRMSGLYAEAYLPKDE